MWKKSVSLGTQKEVASQSQKATVNLSEPCWDGFKHSIYTISGTGCFSSASPQPTHLDWEYVCRMPCVHGKELLMVQGIPHNCVLVIGARGQQAASQREKHYQLSCTVRLQREITIVFSQHLCKLAECNGWKAVDNSTGRLIQKKLNRPMSTTSWQSHSWDSKSLASSLA